MIVKKKWHMHNTSEIERVRERGRRKQIEEVVGQENDGKILMKGGLKRGKEEGGMGGR